MPSRKSDSTRANFLAAMESRRDYDLTSYAASPSTGPSGEFRSSPPAPDEVDDEVYDEVDTYDQVEEKVVGSSEEFEALRKGFTKLYIQSTATISSLKATVSELTDKLNTCQAETGQLETQIAESRAELELRTEQVAASQQELQVKTTQVSTLGEQLQVKTAQVSTLGEQLQVQAAQVAALQEHLRAQTAQVATAQEELRIQMETQASALSTEVSEKVKCSICFEIYDNPHSLDCRHLYCGLCIAHWFAATRNNTCPECRTECREYPQRDYALRDILQMVYACLGKEEFRHGSFAPLFARIYEMLVEHRQRRLGPAKAKKFWGPLVGWLEEARRNPAQVGEIPAPPDDVIVIDDDDDFDMENQGGDDGDPDWLPQ